MLLAKARVRIGQAAQLLERLTNQPAEEEPIDDPEASLETADALWRRLVALRDDRLEDWKSMQVDGLDADDVVQRLNEIVYELLVAIISRTPASSSRADLPPRKRRG